VNDFGRLLEKEIPRLRRYVRGLTYDLSRADDLVQDTLVRAIAKQDFWQRGTLLHGSTAKRSQLPQRHLRKANVLRPPELQHPV
jgi:hypothetical protein